MNIGNRIKEVRKVKGLTQKQLAEKCGMFDSGIRKLESAEDSVTIKTLNKIATALGVTISDLINDKEKPMELKFKKTDTRATMPTRGSAEAAGYDIAILTEEPPGPIEEGYEVLGAYETRMFRTGIAIELPPGYFGDLTGRSSLYRRGLSVKRGVIDSDFRGEIKVVVRNDSSQWVKIYTGERLAQLIIQKHEVVQWREVDELRESERGSGGFGSTGE